MNRLQLMKIHSLVAAFMLPVAIMFSLTGALYTWGIKGSYSNDVYEVKLDSPLSKNAQALRDIAESELHQLDISAPEGAYKIKGGGSNFYLEWTGSSKDITLAQVGNTNTAKLTVKNTSLYRSYVQLHKAKGGIAFKIYAAVFAVAIGLLLISGFIMAWQTPALRKASLLTFSIGLCSFVFIAWLS